MNYIDDPYDLFDVNIKASKKFLKTKTNKMTPAEKEEHEELCLILKEMIVLAKRSKNNQVQIFHNP